MTLPLAGHPVGVVDASSSRRIRRSDSFGVPLPAGRSDAVRAARADLLRARRRERIRRTLSFGDALVRVAESEPRADGYAFDRRCASERAHRYHSPDATAPYEITSRYEWGPDHLPLSMAHPLAEPDALRRLRVRRAARALSPVDRTASRRRACSMRRCGCSSTTTSVGAKSREAYMGARRFPNVGRTRGNVSVPDRRAARRRSSSSPATAGSGCAFSRGIGRAAVGRVLLSPDRATRPAADVEAGPDEIRADT